MACTLGALCDQLTIVKLKQYHTDDNKKADSLALQERELCDEINVFFSNAVAGLIKPDKLVFSANKVYKQQGNELGELQGTSIGQFFTELAKVNCDLWHEQEKVYEFDKVPIDEKDKVVKQLALLNLRRNQCIDAIDKKFQELILTVR